MFVPRASPLIRRLGVRAISGAEIAGAGANVGAVVGPMFILAGGFYALDSKIETKTNHLETKLDSLTQVVNSLSVSIARIEEHMRK
jgi:hypothetical protein